MASVHARHDLAYYNSKSWGMGLDWRVWWALDLGREFSKSSGVILHVKSGRDSDKTAWPAAGFSAEIDAGSLANLIDKNRHSSISQRQVSAPKISQQQVSALKGAEPE